MNRLFVYVSLLMLVSLSCRKDDVPSDIPACVQQQIQAIKAEPVRNPPGFISRFTYKGQTVYFIPSRCCDIPSQLLNEMCTQLCAPDGGIGGNGDGRCSDFYKEARDEQVIWQDPRK